MNVNKEIDQTKLRIKLNDSFNLEELRSLTFGLNIDYEQLEGNTLDAKIISLISFVNRRNQLKDLVTYCSKERPNSNFQELFLSPKTSQDNIALAKQNSNRSKQDNNWAGYLLDYKSVMLKSEDKTIDDICTKCIEALDLHPLLEALNTSEKNVRKFAAKALGEIGGRFDVDKTSLVLALVNAINEPEQDIETKRRVVWALGAIRPSHIETRKHALKALRKLLVNKEEDVSIRWKAAWALGELKATDEVSILAHFAMNNNVHENIRRASLRSLGVLKARNYRYRILSIANSKGNKLERTAAWSLKEMDSKL